MINELIPICYLVDNLKGFGGAEKNLLQIANGLDKTKYRIYVSCLNRGELFDNLRAKGTVATCFNVKKIFSFNGFVQGLNFFRFLRVKQIKILVTYHEGSDIWGSIIAKMAGVPVIISSRRDMGYLLNYKHNLVYRFVNHLFDKIIVVSNAVGQYVCKNQSVNPQKIVTIYNGIEIEDRTVNLFNKSSLLRSSYVKNSQALVVGITASIRPIKGLRYLLEAASGIISKLPNTVFLIVGSYKYDEGCYQVLRSLVKDLGLDNNVFFTGDCSDVMPYINIMDVCVISSLNEGFSNSILEYMACGKPVVATRVGGNVEAVVDGETGFLVSPKDSRSLATKIIQLLDDKELRSQMGLMGHTRVKELFQFDRMISETNDLFMDILRRKNQL